ncbi:hypothetical protein K1719_012358 [Acacia pycnantha]|nr:hypothetical protein K1719_012358 [Acacia pycnantha]
MNERRRKKKEKGIPNRKRREEGRVRSEGEEEAETDSENVKGNPKDFGKGVVSEGAPDDLSSRIIPMEK